MPAAAPIAPTVVCAVGERHLHPRHHRRGQTQRHAAHTVRVTTDLARLAAESEAEEVTGIGVAAAELSGAMVG